MTITTVPFLYFLFLLQKYKIPASLVRYVQVDLLAQGSSFSERILPSKRKPRLYRRQVGRDRRRHVGWLVWHSLTKNKLVVWNQWSLPICLDGDFLGAGGTCSRSPRWPSSTWRSCSTSTWRASPSCWCTMSKTTSARTTSSMQSTPSMLPLTSSFWLVACKVL